MVGWQTSGCVDTGHGAVARLGLHLGGSDVAGVARRRVREGCPVVLRRLVLPAALRQRLRLSASAGRALNSS